MVNTFGHNTTKFSYSSKILFGSSNKGAGGITWNAWEGRETEYRVLGGENLKYHVRERIIRKQVLKKQDIIIFINCNWVVTRWQW